MQVDTGITVEGLGLRISYTPAGIQISFFNCFVTLGTLFAFAILSLVHKQHNLDKGLEHGVGLPI